MKALLEIGGALVVLAVVGVAKFGLPDVPLGFLGSDPSPHQYTSTDNPWAIGAEPETGIRRSTASPFAFRNCAEARAAGAAPVRRGEPGYGAHLDRDNDGIGCETYRGR